MPDFREGDEYNVNRDRNRRNTGSVGNNRSATGNRYSSGSTSQRSSTSNRSGSGSTGQRSSASTRSSSPNRSASGSRSRHSSTARQSSAASRSSTANSARKTSSGTSSRHSGSSSSHRTSSQHNAEARRRDARTHSSGNRYRSSSRHRSSGGGLFGGNLSGGTPHIVYLIAGAALFVLILVVANIASSLSGRTPEKQNEKTQTAAATNESLSSDTEDAVLDEDVDPAPTSTPTPAAAEPVSLTVSVVGDCTLGMDATFDYDTSFNAFYDMYGSTYFMQNVKDIFAKDDLTIANLETTLTTADTKREGRYYNFKAPQEYATILTDGNIEAVSTANNHMYDFLDQGYADTLAALDAENIVHFGFDETAVMDIKGVKVGLIGVYEIDRTFEEIEAEVKDHMEKVRSEGAQLVIVIVHWGEELDTMPDQDAIRIAHMAIDNGADLVCGHHAHVIQGMELYKGKYICYGLSNFCFGGNVYPHDMNSIIFQQTFTVTGDQVSDDRNINIIPISISSEYSFNNYQPTPSSGDEAVSILTKLRERTEALTTAEPQPADLLKSDVVDQSVLTLTTSGGGLIGGSGTAGNNGATGNAGTAGTSVSGNGQDQSSASDYDSSYDEDYDSDYDYDSGYDDSYYDEEAYYDSLYNWD